MVGSGCLGRDPDPALINDFLSTFLVCVKAINTSVAEPEPQGAASFGRSRSRNAMRLRLLRYCWVVFKKYTNLVIFVLFLCIFTTIFAAKNQKKKECRTLCYLLLLLKLLTYIVG
jgi:hypothetical protein